VSSPEMFSLKGRVALVTGASRGIGASIAKRLAKAGAEVVLNFRSNRDLAEQVLGEVQKVSPKSSLLAFDVADSEASAQAIEGCLRERGKIDLLVCNAGIARDALLLRATPEHFEEVWRTNFLGTANIVRLVARAMLKNRYGRIVCLGSVVGEMGNKGQAAYSASKSALEGFSKSVARELGSRGITCNIVSPGFIETEMTGSLPEEVKKAYFASIPLERFGSAQEVASTVHFLLSEEAAYITGASLGVNGGLWMR